jgi:hypothetical protein
MWITNNFSVYIDLSELSTKGKKMHVLVVCIQQGLHD